MLYLKICYTYLFEYAFVDHLSFCSLRKVTNYSSNLYSIHPASHIIPFSAATLIYHLKYFRASIFVAWNSDDPVCSFPIDPHTMADSNK